MATTKKQREREALAKTCDRIAGKGNQTSQQLRGSNRHVEKRKRNQHRAKGIA